jgi:hypothetical protein
MNDAIKSEIFFEGDDMVHKTTQPSEDLILEQNSELRKNEDAIKNLQDEDGETWGRQVASIPLIMWEKAKRDGYDLSSRDSATATKELWRFLRSEEGKKCLVGNQSGKLYVGGLNG